MSSVGSGMEGENVSGADMNMGRVVMYYYTVLYGHQKKSRDKKTLKTRNIFLPFALQLLLVAIQSKFKFGKTEQLWAIKPTTSYRFSPPYLLTVYV